MVVKKKDGDLILDDLDIGDLVVGDLIIVEFWFRKFKIKDDKEIKFYYYDGSNYDEIVKLDNLGVDEIWLYYQDIIIDIQYFYFNFYICIIVKFGDKNGWMWVDDVFVRKKGGVGGW